MLTQPAVARYLLRRELISAQSLVAGDLAVLNATRRNSNFKVVSEQAPSYLLKQGVGPEREATVAHEAAIYRLLHSVEDGQRLRRYLPRLYLYSPEEHILVIELLRDARNLGEHCRRHGRFSTSLAGALGDALAALHRIDVAEQMPDHDEGDSVVPARSAPWPLSFHRPDMRLYLELSYANLQLISVMQRFPEFGGLLDSLRSEWRQQALVHYDIKFENLLVARAGPGHRNVLKIVDWELAGMGDPCWDVGAVFGEYLGLWLLSIPITGEDPPDRFLELARYPLSKIQPAIRRFWQVYTQHMELDSRTSAQWLVRAVKYGAARLIQTAFEQGQTQVQPTGNALGFLQLSLNMLQRPEEAAVHLLGIPWQPVWTQ